MPGLRREIKAGRSRPRRHPCAGRDPWVRTHSEPPIDDSGDGDGCEEVLDFSIVSGCEPPPVLEAAEHPFDDVALVVDALVVRELNLAMTQRWDDGDGAALSQPMTQGVGVVSFVGDQFVARRQRFDTLHRDRDIRDISGSYDERPGAAAFVAQGMKFGLASMLGTADTIGQGPPFAPPAVR